MLRSKTHIKRKGAIFSVLVAIFLLGIGAVVAFNSDQFNFANLFNLGAHQVEYKEDFVSPPDWKPCDVTPKTVITTNKSTTPIKVRLSYDEFWRNKTDTGNLPLEDNGIPLAIINFQNEADWTLQGGWYYYNYDLEPGQSTSSLFESVALNCEANFGSLNTCTETETGTVCTEVENPYEDAKYHLSITVQTSSGDFSHEGEHYAVTINPNGGKYNDSTEIYTAQVDYGTVIDLSSATYVGHDLENWTLNNSETYTDSSITVTSDINLKANWVSSTWYTVTINPNGGTFENHTEAYDTPVRQGGNFVLSETEPTREGYLFEGWFVGENTPLENHTFAVTDDVTITAKWGQITAQNNRTNKLYSSLTSAESEAQSGDTITLLRNAEETFVNGKNITLDLGNHVLSGSITNNDTMTLINGEVNNADGAAFVNNGSLTMGINDYIDENTVNIESSAVRLIGTDTGLKQNGTFNFYDGFIEGEIALEGGYNDSPFYRKAMDDEIVHYFPFVDKSPNSDELQRVILESSDLAVSKTKVGGDIYYYSLQDNINTSIRTGYKIYIAREDWSTGEPITVPENTDITIDLEGHTFTATDTITVNGKLTIEDSHSAINSETGEVEYAGNIQTPQTTINSGELVMKNSRMTGTTANDTVRNYATLTMRGGRLGATSGYVMQPVDGATYDLDNKSYLYSTNTSKAAVYNSLSNFIWSKGNIYGNYIGLQNAGGSSSKTITTTLLGGKIKSSSIGVNLPNNSYSKLIIDGGDIEVEAPSDTSKTLYGVKVDSAYASGQGIIELRSGNINLINGSSNYGTSYGHLTMTGGSINITTSKNGDSYGTYSRRTNITGGSITVNSTGTGTVYGAYPHSAYDSTASNATITVSGGAAVYGLYNNGSNTASENLIIHATTSSTSKGAYGFYCKGSATVSDGTITATAPSSTSIGVYNVGSSRITITGESLVSGGTYGIHVGDSGFATLGSNDGAVSIEYPEVIGGSYALYGNSINFFDGVLRGGAKAYQEGTIRATPDGTTYHIESSANYTENCWLIDAVNYLQVGETEYNSLTKAYDAITGSSGTIKVIADTTVEAVLPNSPTDKIITFDLNGHELTYTQRLFNNGTMIIVDSSPDKTGKLLHPTSDNATIVNHGHLTLESGYISSARQAIYNEKGSTFVMNGGTIESTNYGIYNNGSSGSTDGATNAVTATINGGTVVGANYGIHNGSYSTTTLLGGKIKSSSIGVNLPNNSYSKLIIDGGDIEVEAPSDTSKTLYGVKVDSAYASGQGIIELRSGNINLINGSSNYGTSYGHLTMTGGSINITTSKNGDSYGTYSRRTNITGGSITVNSTGTGTVYGAYPHSAYDSTASNATITVSGGAAVYGLYNNGSNTASENLIIHATTSSTSKGAYGFYCKGSATVSDGTITATAPSSTSIGVYNVGSSRITITGESLVSGGTYGIHVGDSGFATLGSNDGAVSIEYPEVIGGSYALYGNSINFFDGVLRGGAKAYQEGTIRATPDGTTYHIESSANYTENCWLIDAVNYLQVGETEYNSLTKAYDAITGSSGTIKVIADTTVEAVLPNSPTDKIITFDLNGHELTYTQRLFNNGTMIIVDSSPDKTGKLLHPTSDNATIVNHGHLTLESGYISSARQAIYNEKGSTFVMNGGTIESTNYGIYNNGSSGSTDGATNAVTATINGGTVVGANYGIHNGSYSTTTLLGGKIKSSSIGVNLPNNSYSKLIIDGGDIEVEAPSDTSKTLYGVKVDSAYASGQGIIELRSGNINLINGSSNYGTSYGHLTMTGGSINITTSKNGDSYGTYSRRTNITGGSITVNSTGTGTVYGAYPHSAYDSTASNATITVSGGAAVYGLYNNGSNTASENLIIHATTSSTSKGAYGFYCKGSATVSDGTITATAPSSTSIGVYNVGSSRITITGESLVSGGTYGIHVGDSGFATLGSNDGAVSIEYPEVIGGSYALYGNSINFFDGVLRGGAKAYQEGTIKSIPDDYTLAFGSQTISDIAYETCHLAAEHNVAKIGDVYYKNLLSAINAAEEDDIIELIEDNLLFKNMEIASDKKFSILTNGFDIRFSNKLTNNGIVSIINNGSNRPTFDYFTSGYLITNNVDAEMTLKNIPINAVYGIENKGTLTLENVTINATNTAIKNTGDLNASTISLSASTYPFYNDGGESSISGATINGGILYNNAGNVSLTNSNATKTGDGVKEFVTNRDTLSLDSTNILLSSTKRPGTCDSSTISRTIYNAGSLYATNNTSITHITTDTNNSACNQSSAIYNYSGIATIQNTSITLDTTGMKSYSSHNAYAIYNPTGHFAVESGSITSRAFGSSYGIYTNSGTITIGKPEPADSPNYGGANADVSQDNPSIIATSTSTNKNYRAGVGIYSSTGRVEYYDGVISGSTASFAVEPTVTEHFYEPCTELDTTVTPNLYTTHLFWMRDGQSTCANN